MAHQIRVAQNEAESIKLFESRQIHSVWNDEEQEWYFSVVDVVGALTDSLDYQQARKYWNKLKERLVKEGNETVTNCHQLKLVAADGKRRNTDVATTEQILRIIQSIPSKKAEGNKLAPSSKSPIAFGRFLLPKLFISLRLVTTILSN